MEETKRIDELAQPNRRYFLDLYQNHAKKFSGEKFERLRQKLERLFAMTPEETAQYFKLIKKQEKPQRKSRKVTEIKDEEKAYEFIEKLLVKLISYFVRHPAGALVTSRVRTLSDLILQEICVNYSLGLKNKKFLMQICDCLALKLERLYFEVQVKKNFE